MQQAVSAALGLQWDSQYCGPFNGQIVYGSVWRDTLDWEIRWDETTVPESKVAPTKLPSNTQKTTDR